MLENLKQLKILQCAERPKQTNTVH